MFDLTKMQGSKVDLIKNIRLLPSTSQPPVTSCYSVGTEQMTVYRNSAKCQTPAFLTNVVWAVTSLKLRGQVTANSGFVQPADRLLRSGR